MARKLVAAAATGLLVTAGLLVPASTATASTACSGSSITINKPSGAEAASTASGHGHVTGNHYIRSTAISAGKVIYTWWADNSGGSDGDTWDTFYSTKTC